MNTHIQSVKVCRKSILPWVKYSIFLPDCFLLAHPVDVSCHIFGCLVYVEFADISQVVQQMMCSSSCHCVCGRDVL